MSEIKISVPPLAKLQSRWSEKWRAFDPEILPMPFAVMDYELAAPIKATLTSLIENSDAGYLGKIPELPEGLAHFAKARWGWDIYPAQVKIAPDVGVGVIEIARLVTKPGDKILINTPVYYNFYNWITELHCTLVDAPLKENNLRYELDFAAIEASYATGVKVHILCNPHNPVGALFTKAELAELAELAKKYGVLIASDEIHAPLVYRENTFTPFLAASETAREVGIAFLSATKAFNIAGLKCAQIV
ncbi:MAG: aminotransferase class I/II-fold pyridoxal phosphate-dependent enzyme, partial [Actinomycetes bacterium]